MSRRQTDSIYGSPAQLTQLGSEAGYIHPVLGECSGGPLSVKNPGISRRMSIATMSNRFRREKLSFVCLFRSWRSRDPSSKGTTGIEALWSRASSIGSIHALPTEIREQLRFRTRRRQGLKLLRGVQNGHDLSLGLPSEVLLIEYKESISWSTTTFGSNNEQ